MSTEISLQQKLQEKISDRIRSSFIDMIPQEEFDKMVAAALDEFINGPEAKRFDWKYPPGKYDGPRIKVPKSYDLGQAPYNPINDPSTFSGMIMQELKEQGKKTLLDILSKEPFMGIWSNRGQEASTIVKQAIGENVNIFVEKLFGNLVQNAMMQMQQAIQNNPRIF